ncbi:MAG: hypothetical protein M0D57_07130 [Sphingobacteriales bacterium JAD_PAG50586_3]|nr:MAG: hypothetical protein M0D57_07130 [Sphingobacteriales bacterium JAD_PAG50586_3]
MCGSTRSFGSGQSDAFAIRLNANGDTLWTKLYGSTRNDVFNSVVVVPSGGFVMVGYASQPNGYNDIYIVKTDANGNIIWQKAFGTLAISDYASVVKTTPDGGFIVGGTSYINSYTSYVVIKLSSTGSVEWSSSYIGPNTSGNSLSDLIVENDGSIVAVGNYSDIDETGIINFKLDSDGAIVWKRNYRQANVDLNGRAVVAIPGGGYLLAGYSENDGGKFI